MSDLALFFHILGVLLFVSGIAVAGVAFESARRREQPAEISLLLGLSRIGVLLVVVGSLMILGFGLWLVGLEDFGFGEGWISAALALFVAALVLGGVAGQTPKRARLLATKLAEKGDPGSAELRALLDDRRSLLANYLAAPLAFEVQAGEHPRADRTGCRGRRAPGRHRSGTARGWPRTPTSRTFARCI